MRIAHLSDLHLLDLTGAGTRRFLNKRLTGYLNLKLKRGHHHKPEPVRLAARQLAQHGVDHVVVTGDLSNLALEREFERVCELLEDDLGMAPEQISLVPGNHDAYTRGAVKSRRFLEYFARYMSSDLSGIATLDGFPFVRLRGELAIIGLSTAVARPPLMAAGRLGTAQLAALRGILAHPEVQRRTPVILQHHPLHQPASRLKALLEGLHDASALLEALQGVDHGLLLHGHLHRRMQSAVPTARGQLHAIGATSASLLSEDPARMAGFNLYDFGTDGRLSEVSAQRYRPASGDFELADVPTRTW